MIRLSSLALFGGLFLLSGGLAGQDGKKDDPKATKKDDSPVKIKAALPAHWSKIGLSDEQKQEVYKILSKHNSEIDKLKAQIDEHKAAKDREAKALLTVEQKKRLDDILTGKDKEKAKEKEKDKDK